MYLILRNPGPLMNTVLKKSFSTFQLQTIKAEEKFHLYN